MSVQFCIALVIPTYFAGLVSRIIIAANVLNSAILSVSLRASPVDSDTSRAVSRLSFCLFASAPHFSSSFAHCVKALLAARCSGVLPHLSVTEGEAPSKRKAETYAVT